MMVLTLGVGCYHYILLTGFLRTFNQNVVHTVPRFFLFKFNKLFGTEEKPNNKNK